MNAMRKIGILILCTAWLSGCSSLSHRRIHSTANPPITLPNTPIVVCYPVNSFDKLVINGDMDVVLTSQDPGYSVTATGMPAQLNTLNISNTQNTLYVSQRGFNRRADGVPTQLVINLPDLHQLQYQGAGHLTANNLNSSALVAKLNNQAEVNLNGKQIYLQQLIQSGRGPVTISGVDSNALFIKSTSGSPIELTGTVNLRSLTYEGNGRLHVYWLNSPYLRVHSSGSNYIMLAGITTMLDAVVSGRNYLDAKHLHAQQAFVNTADNARADVWIRQSLNALATGNSNIYYYHPAKIQGIYMHTSGSVMDMAGIDPNAVPVVSAIQY